MVAVVKIMTIYNISQASGSLNSLIKHVFRYGHPLQRPKIYVTGQGHWSIASVPESGPANSNRCSADRDGTNLSKGERVF
jgi:hypothetical protein